MEMLDNAINWLEIPAADFERAKKFYSTIYDYEMPVNPGPPIKMAFLPYEMVQQRVGAAICFGQGYSPSQTGVLPYLNGGNDLNTVLNRVEKAGGKVLLPKTFITKEVGYIAHFLDSEGNRIGLHSRN